MTVLVLEFLDSLIEGDGKYLDIDYVDQIKKEFCYVAKNYYTEHATPVSLNLPWGGTVTLYDSQFKAPELLFFPILENSREHGLVVAIFDAINLVPSHNDNWELFLRNIVLGGGNSMLKGLKERLESEIGRVGDTDIDVTASNDRQFSAWIGASMVSAA